MCKLARSLYGLKQAIKQWYKKFDSYMTEIGYKRCGVDFCCYQKKTEQEQEQLDMERLPYYSAVGSLMYVMIYTWPNLSYAVEVVSRFVSNPGQEHWKAIIWVLRYIQNSLNFDLVFSGKSVVLQGLCDVDLGSDIDSSRSTSRYDRERRRVWVASVVSKREVVIVISEYQTFMR